MKKNAMMGIVAALCLGSGMTAFAAPETMPDGTVFDAEYYAQIYPDVVAVFGTDADAMYRHYLKYGRNEGRLAYDITTQLPADMENTKQQAAEQPQIIGIQGVAGVAYELPTWGQFDTSDGVGTDQMINMEVEITPDLSFIEDDLPDFAPYTTEGYEWKFIQYRITGMQDAEYKRWWPNSYTYCNVENSKDWTWAEDGANYARKFTVTQNGVDYTECKLYYGSGGQVGEVSVMEGTYVLLPKGFTGKVYFTVKGTTLGEYGVTANDDAAVTFVL